MKKIFALIILVFAVWAFLERKPESWTQPLTEKFHKSTVIAKIAPVLQTHKIEKTFEKKLHDEASLIGRIDSAPEDTEERLQNWAKSLSEKEIDELESLALDRNKPQDDRFLAVMLMGWSENPTALDNLKDIALTDIDPYLSPNRMGDFERVLRMQAVDGMIDIPAQTQQIEDTLQSVASKTSDSTIADRANRALWALRGDAPKPQEQDQKALEDLLKKPARN